MTKDFNFCNAVIAIKLSLQNVTFRNNKGSPNGYDWKSGACTLNLFAVVIMSGLV